MKNLSLLICILLFACSSAPEPKKETAKNEYENLCSQGSKEACFVQAMTDDQNGLNESSKKFLEKACALNHAHACTQMGINVATEDKNLTQGILFSKKGCDEMDSTGCYNVACFSCQKGDKFTAIQFLARAIELGFDQPKLLEEDPDLACIRNEKILPGIIESLKNKKGQTPTTPFHQPFHSLGIAMSVPSGFEVAIPFPATLRDSSGSWIRITSAAVSIQHRIKNLKKTQSTLGTDLESGDGSTNSADYYWVKFGVKAADSIAMVFVIGNENRSVRIEGFVPKLLARDFGSLVFSSIRSTVFDPRADFSQNIVDFDLGKSFLGLKPVGPVESAIEFTTTGKALQDSAEGQFETIPSVRVFPIRVYADGLADNFERMTAADIVHESLPRLDEINSFSAGKFRNLDDKEFLVTEAEGKYTLLGAKNEINLISYMIVLKGKPAVAFLASWSGPIPKGGKDSIILGLKNWAKSVRKQIKKLSK